jgi:Tol biopolymer transport system component
MSSLDWVPQLAAALDELVPIDDGSGANWDDVVVRVARRRRLGLWRGRPHRGLRLALVVALIFLLLAGVATATYLLVRGDARLALGGGSSPLFVTNRGGHGMQLVARCPATGSRCEIDDPTWSPDGTQLAFLRGHIVGRLLTSHMTLYVAAANGTRPRPLASCDYCGDSLGGRISWSPDGRWIAFSSGNAPGRSHQQWISVVAASGGPPRRLCASCNGFDPAWSPDGRLIVFGSTPPDEPGPPSGSLYAVHPDGTSFRMIVKSGSDPEWAPDGRRIVFETAPIVFETAPESIAVANADGSDLQVLFTGPLELGGPRPSWSPDGHKLVFVQTPGVHPHFYGEVWTMNADGSDRERLYRSGCCVLGGPTWSPDGRLIAFSAPAGTFVSDANGSGIRRLSPIAFGHLSWISTPKGAR